MFGPMTSNTKSWNKIPKSDMKRERKSKKGKSIHAQIKLHIGIWVLTLAEL
jgi:hypothetical protein